MLTMPGMTGPATILRADARALPLPDTSVDLIVTSPPYYALRSYTDTCRICLVVLGDGRDPAVEIVDYADHVRRHHHYAGQIGSERTPAEYIDNLIDCTREWMRVLKPSGSMFINLGDKYSDRGHGPNRGRGTGRGPQATHLTQTRGPLEKSLLLLPERYRIACVDQLGLIARAVIVWEKVNGLPESVTDRVRRSHEDWVHLVKQPRYYSAVDTIREHHTGNAHPRGKNASAQTWTSGNGVRHRTAHGNPEDFNPLGKLPGSVWSVPSEPLTVPEYLGVDHFAAFPTEWPRRTILGWSPSGICTECGEGRRPVNATTLTVDRGGRQTQRGVSAIGGGRTGQTLGRERVITITGEACACTPYTEHPGEPPIFKPWREHHFDQWLPAPTHPAVVLDPFGGTGTTALAARALGRHGITVDRSSDYCRIAEWRTTDPDQLAKAMRVDKPPRQVDDQLTLDLAGEATA